MPRASNHNIKMDSKSIPKRSKIGPEAALCFQNDPKRGPEGLWGPSRALKRFQDPTRQQNLAHLGPKICPKSNWKPSKLDLESDFETNSLSRPIWDRFSIDFRAVGSKFLIQIESLYLQSERDIRQNRIL